MSFQFVSPQTVSDLMSRVTKQPVNVTKSVDVSQSDDQICDVHSEIFPSQEGPNKEPIGPKVWRMGGWQDS